MELKQLRFFVQVAELGGFAKAAEMLEIPQPTLSRKVRALEVSLGATLLHRNGRGVLLTPEGIRFLEQARGVLHAAEAAAHVIHEGDRRLRGKVVCGITPSVGRVMIPELVRRFGRELPAASLSIVNLSSSTLYDYLRAGRLDFAIVHQPATPSADLTIQPLRMEPVYVISARKPGAVQEKFPLAKLDKLPLILPSSMHTLRRQLESAAAQLGIKLNVVLEIDVIDPLLTLVAEGFGSAIATKYALLDSTATQNVVAQQLTPMLSAQLCLGTPSVRTMTSLQAAAARIAQEAFHDIAKQPLLMETRKLVIRSKTPRGRAAR